MPKQCFPEGNGAVCHWYIKQTMFFFFIILCLEVFEGVRIISVEQIYHFSCENHTRLVGVFTKDTAALCGCKVSHHHPDLWGWCNTRGSDNDTRLCKCADRLRSNEIYQN